MAHLFLVHSRVSMICLYDLCTLQSTVAKANNNNDQAQSLAISSRVPSNAVIESSLLIGVRWEWVVASRLGGEESIWRFSWSFVRLQARSGIVAGHFGEVDQIVRWLYEYLDRGERHADRADLCAISVPSGREGPRCKSRNVR